jgi:hypothetical protein
MESEIFMIYEFFVQPIIPADGVGFRFAPVHAAAEFVVIETWNT